MVIKSSLPDVDIPGTPLGPLVIDCLEKFGDNVAVVEIHSGREITYKELRDETLKMVKLLWKAGLRKGDIVGLVLPFDMQYAPLFFAIVYCGAIIFGTKLLYKSSIHNQLAAIKPTLVITTSKRLDEISGDLNINVPSVKFCLSFDQLSDIKPGILGKVPEDEIPAKEYIDVHNDVAMIYQSSGTTGKPKGILTPHYAVLASIQAFADYAILKPGDVLASVSPIIHVQSLNYLFDCICSGVKLVYAHNLSPEEHLEAFAKYKVNFMVILNVNVLKGIIERKDIQKSANVLTHLRTLIVGGTTFPPKLIQEARDKLGIVVAMGYGMTEAGIIAVGVSNDVPPSSVGQLMRNTILKIVDKDSGKELGCGEKGEICVQGPQNMKGYFLEEGSQLEAFKDGWLHSGDLGYYDEQNYLYVIGRAKDAIKIHPGSVTAMPAELEDVLLRHKQVSDVAVAAVPHFDYGEAPRAFLVRKDNSLTEKEVVRFFESEIEKITSLHGGVEFVDVIPRTDTGKPLRRTLVEESLKNIEKTS